MERDQDIEVVVELGVASEETKGVGGPAPDLSRGIPFAGLTDD